MYDSVVMAIKMSMSEQRSELKRLELDIKDQKVMVGQYVQYMQNQLAKFSVRNERGKFYGDVRLTLSRIIIIF